MSAARVRPPPLHAWVLELKYSLLSGSPVTIAEAQPARSLRFQLPEGNRITWTFSLGTSRLFFAGIHMFHPLLPQAIFDRNRKDELPGLQLEWIDGICAPLYEVKQQFGLRASSLSRR